MTIGTLLSYILIIYLIIIMRFIMLLVEDGEIFSKTFSKTFIVFLMVTFFLIWQFHTNIDKFLNIIIL